MQQIRCSRPKRQALESTKPFAARMATWTRPSSARVISVRRFLRAVTGGVRRERILLHSARESQTLGLARSLAERRVRVHVGIAKHGVRCTTSVIVGPITTVASAVRSVTQGIRLHAGVGRGDERGGVDGRHPDSGLVDLEQVCDQRVEVDVRVREVVEGEFLPVPVTVSSGPGTNVDAYI